MNTKITYKKAKVLEEKYGSPLFVFNRSVLQNQCEIMSEIVENQSNISAFYMMKANWHPEIISEIVQYGIGIVISSQYELNIIKKKAPMAKLIAVGPAKKESFLKQLVDENVELIIVENIYEANFINEYARSKNKIVKIGCRYELAIEPHAGRIKKCVCGKFGWTKNQFLETIIRISNFDNLKICCISANIGSQVCNQRLFFYALEQLIEVSKTLKEKNIKIEYIDIGGGYPIPDIERKYSSVLSELSKLITKRSIFDDFEHCPKNFDISLLLSLLSNKCREEGLNLIVEPGRWFVANSMQLLCKVVALKEKNGANYVFVDAGIDVLPDVGFGEKRKFETIMQKQPSNKLSQYIVAGPLCMKSDILSNSVLIDSELKVNDYIMVKSVGAYCLSRTSLFSGFIPSIIELGYEEERVLFQRKELSIF